MRFEAAPNIERKGVIAGFVLSRGEGLRPAITVGVLFAQGTMYRPASAPLLPEAPAAARSWLHYHTGSGFYWTSTPEPYQSDDASLGWVVTDTISVIAYSAQSIGSGDTAQPIQSAAPAPIASRGAPNQTPVTTGDNRCRVVLVPYGNRTMWQFAGAVVFHSSDPNYDNLKNIEVFADHSVGAANDRVLGYLSPPVAGQGDVTEYWYTDLRDLPQGSDDIWALEFRALNADGQMTADPPRVEGLVVPHDTTAPPPGVDPLTIPAVTLNHVTKVGYDSTSETLLFAYGVSKPADVANFSGFKMRVYTPDLPYGQDVTGLIPLGSFNPADGGYASFMQFHRGNLPVGAPQDWTFKAVSYNAAGDGNNESTAPSAGPITVDAVSDVPDFAPPLAPTSVSAADTGNRILLGNNETYTWIRVTPTLPANHRATRLVLWFSDNGGSSWAVITNQWLPSVSYYDFVWRVPPTQQTNWKVRLATATLQYEPNESSAVESQPITVNTLAAPGANLVTDGEVGGYKYGTNADGVQVWGLEYIRWTNPTPEACPEFFHSQLTVQKCDAAGNPAPDWEGVERIVDESTFSGKLFSYVPHGWGIPSSPTYKYYRLRCYLVNRNLDRILQTACWSWAAYAVVSPTDPGGALQLQRAAPASLGAELSTTGTKLEFSPVNTSTVLPNGDFEITDPTNEDWCDKWAFAGNVTRESSGAETGSYRVKMGNGSTIFSEFIKCSKGQRYSVEVRAKADASVGGSLFITHAYFDMNKTLVGLWPQDLFNRTPGTSWETIGHSGDVPDGSGGSPAGAYYMQIQITALAAANKFHYVDRIHVTRVLVQQDAYDASLNTGVTLGQHLNASSQFAGVAVARTSGRRSEMRDDFISFYGDSGRMLGYMGTSYGSPDFGTLRVIGDNASTYPWVGAAAGAAGGLFLTVALDATHSITISFNGANPYIDLYGGAGELRVNGQKVVTARQAAVSSPAAEVNSLKTAVDALINRLQLHGLIG